MKVQDLVSSPPEDSDGRTIMAARPSEDFHGWWVVGWGKGRLEVDEVGGGLERHIWLVGQLQCALYKVGSCVHFIFFLTFHFKFILKNHP
jgi:hypothetical protein